MKAQTRICEVCEWRYIAMEVSLFELLLNIFNTFIISAYAKVLPDKSTYKPCMQIYISDNTQVNMNVPVDRWIKIIVTKV